MKTLHTNYPFWFGLVFLIVYGILDYTDAKWFIPRIHNKSRTCDVSDTCEWIRDNTKDIDYIKP